MPKKARSFLRKERESEGPARRERRRRSGEDGRAGRGRKKRKESGDPEKRL